MATATSKVPASNGRIVLVTAPGLWTGTRPAIVVGTSNHGGKQLVNANVFLDHANDEGVCRVIGTENTFHSIPLYDLGEYPLNPEVDARTSHKAYGESPLQVWANWPTPNVAPAAGSTKESGGWRKPETTVVRDPAEIAGAIGADKPVQTKAEVERAIEADKGERPDTGRDTPAATGG